MEKGCISGSPTYDILNDNGYKNAFYYKPIEIRSSLDTKLSDVVTRYLNVGAHALSNKPIEELK